MRVISDGNSNLHDCVCLLCALARSSNPPSVVTTCSVLRCSSTSFLDLNLKSQMPQAYALLEPSRWYRSWCFWRFLTLEKRAEQSAHFSLPFTLFLLAWQAKLAWCLLKLNLLPKWRPQISHAYDMMLALADLVLNCKWSSRQKESSMLLCVCARTRREGYSYLIVG